MLIISDMDGVVADFVSGALAVHNRHDFQVDRYDWFVDDWGMTSEQFWSPIKLVGSDFYQHYVSTYSWTPDYLKLLKEFGTVVFATDNPADPGLSYSKVRWMNDHLGAYDTFLTLRGVRNTGKELLATPSRVLIDDSDSNVKKFREHGGIAILFPQPWNEGRFYTDRRLEFVKNELAVVFANIL